MNFILFISFRYSYFMTTKKVKIVLENVLFTLNILKPVWYIMIYTNIRKQ